MHNYVYQQFMETKIVFCFVHSQNLHNAAVPTTDGMTGRITHTAKFHCAHYWWDLFLTPPVIKKSAPGGV